MVKPLHLRKQMILPGRVTRRLSFSKAIPLMAVKNSGFLKIPVTLYASFVPLTTTCLCNIVSS